MTPVRSSHRRPLEILPRQTAIAPSWQMLALTVRPLMSAVLAGPKPTILGWPYHIGTHGKPWGVDERKQWLAERVVHRSYKEEVVAKIDALRERSEYEVLEYGALSHDASRYPLYAVKTRDWDASKPAALVSVLPPAAQHQRQPPPPPPPPPPPSKLKSTLTLPRLAR